MALRQKDIDRLEIMFSEDCQIAIDTLAYHGMSEEQYLAFETCLKTFKNYKDLKDFVSESLLGKVKEVSRLFYPNRTETWFNFRKLVRLLVRFSDEESVDAFVSYLLTGRRPHHYFVLLGEMVAHGIDTRSAQKVFESLISVHGYTLDVINTYLTITKQDSYGLIKNLVLNSYYAGVIRYIREINSNGKDVRLQLLGEQIIPSLIENFIGDRTHYLGITMSVCEGGVEFIKELTHNSQHIGDVEEKFAQYIVTNHIQMGNMPLIKNMMAYLELNNSGLIPSIEDKILKDNRPGLILLYAQEVPVSNKRKVLVRLIELKDEKFVVEFIKKFPTFRSLMPML